MRAGRSARVLVAALAMAAAAAVGCAGRQKSGAAGQRSDDVVCTYAPVTGSHIAEARCLTRGEMAERQAASRRSMERLIINANRPSGRRPVSH